MDWDPIDEKIDSVFHLPVRTQTLPPHQHTNSFLIGNGETALVDAGQWEDQDMESLLAFLGRSPGRRLSRLFLTHWHPDHCVGAERIRKSTGCRVGVPVYEAEKGGEVPWDFTFQDGDCFSVDGRDLEVIHTPGHSSGHCCFFLRDERVLFTGDHILGRGTSIIVPPDGNMTLYLRSLEALLALPARIICPGHGPLVLDAKGKIREYIEHRIERERRILEGVREGVRNPERLVERVYTDVPVQLHGMAYYSLLAHLIKLEEERKVRTNPKDGGYEPA